MKSFFNELFTFEHPDSVGVKAYLRIFELFIIIYTMIYAWRWGFYILHISDVVLPLGMANYINVELFFGNDLALYSAGLITVLLGIGFYTRKVRGLYLIAFLLFHIQYAARFSQGEIPHSSNLVGFGLLGLGLGAIFFKEKWKALSFGYGLAVFFIGLGYTSASVSKLIGTGITWADGQHLWLWITEKSSDVLAAQGSYNLNFLQQLALKNRVIATIILLAGWLTEACAFLMWWKKTRPLITVLIIGMHLGIYITMNIWFMSYMIGLPIMGLPWHRLINYFYYRNAKAIP